MAAADLDDGAMLAKMNAIASLPPSAALHRSANLRYVAGVVNGRSAREGDSTPRNRFEIPFPSAADATALATESVALLCNAVATLRSFARPKRCRQASIRRHVRFSIRKEFASVGVLDPERLWKQGPAGDEHLAEEAKWPRAVLDRAYTAWSGHGRNPSTTRCTTVAAAATSCRPMGDASA
jgi:hypothetical protein